MALQRFLSSWTVEDAKGRKASVPVYGLYDDATETIASLVSWMDTVSVQLDDITEAKVVSQSLSIYPALGAGLKASPVANSDVQETGLLTFRLNGLNAKSYSIDIPALVQAKFVGENINLADTDIVAFTDTMVNNVSGIGPTEDIWSKYLEAIRKGRKAFRKLGGR